MKSFAWTVLLCLLFIAQLQAQTLSLVKPVPPPNEQILVNFSDFQGAPNDWISIAAIGSAEDKYLSWVYTSGGTSGQVRLEGMPPGEYELRGYFANGSVVKTRMKFTVGNAVENKKACRTELSTFYQSMNSLGLCWGRLGSDAFIPATIAGVQTQLTNVPVGITAIGCLDFDVSKITSFSSRLPGMTHETAVNEIDGLIKELLASVLRARVTCDKGELLEQLFSTGIHLGAAQGIANSFVCNAISVDWQGNLRNHLGLVSSGISSFGPCIPGVNPTTALGVPVGAGNAYEAFSVIVGLHMQVLWAVSLSDCCCACP